jgi:hypothetical protein
MLAEEASPRAGVSEIIDTRALAYIVGYFLLYLLVIGLSFNKHDYFYRTSKADSGSYMSHAFTIGLDGDLNYENEFSALADCPGGGGDDQGCPCMNPARTSPCHPMGPGLMAAPFVAAFSVIDRLNNHPVLTNRLAYLGSWSYFGIQFATAFYFFSGIALYQLALRRWISPLTVALAVLSSGILWYVTYRFSFGHAYEFFDLALLTAGCVGLCSATDRWQQRGLVVVIAVATFLAIMVRWVDYGLLAVPLMVVLTHYLIERAGRYRRALLLGYVGVAAGAVMVAVFHFYAFGVLWPTSDYFYGETIEENIRNPLPYPLLLSLLLSVTMNLTNLPLLVFSSEFGLLYSFPLFPIAILTMLFMWARNFMDEPLPWTLWALAVGFCVSVPLALVLLWETTASAYGYRYLLSAIPALILSAAVFLNSRKIENSYGRNGEWTDGVIGLILSLAGFLALVSFVAQIGFEKVAGFTLGPQINVFGVKHLASARGYMDAVFAALLNPSAWRVIYLESLFHQIAWPSPPMREMPQLVKQSKILLLVVPLVGAVLSAGTYARNVKPFVATSALVVLMLTLLWSLASIP